MSSPSLPTFRSWLIFGIMALAYVEVSVHRTGTSTLALDIIRDLSLGGTVMALISSGYFYAYGLMQIPAGILADHWGARRTISCFLLLGAAGSVLMGLAPSPGLLIVGRILVGMGMGMVYIPALRGLMGWFPVSRHTLITGLFLSAGPFGMMLATVPLEVLSRTLGWRSVLIGTGLVTLLTAVAVWLIVRDQATPAPGVSRSVRVPLWQGIRSILSDRLYLACVVYFFCTPGFFYSFTGLWATPYFVQGYGLTPEQGGTVLLCFALGAGLTPIVAAAVAERFRLPKQWLLAVSSLGTGLLGLPLVCPSPVLPYAGLLVWAVVLGGLSGGFSALCLSFVQEQFPLELAGTAMGMTNIALFAGVTVMQIASGGILDILSPESSVYTIGHFALTFVLYVALQIAGLAAMLICPSSRRQLAGTAGR